MRLALKKQHSSKIISQQFEQHASHHHLHETFQSAYKKCHSTETALLKVQNDILTTIDDGKLSCLVLLDLSSAFDTIDQNVLLDRLNDTMSQAMLSNGMNHI